MGCTWMCILYRNHNQFRPTIEATAHGVGRIRHD
jgi:hypothetical protein